MFQEKKEDWVDVSIQGLETNRETESLLIAVQNNAIWINHVKVKIDKTQV